MKPEVEENPYSIGKKTLTGAEKLALGGSGNSFAGFQASELRAAAATQFVPELNVDGTRPVYDFGDPFETGGVTAANGSAAKIASKGPLAAVTPPVSNGSPKS